MIIKPNSRYFNKRVEKMKKSVTVFCCQQCGHTENKWLGKCPECSSWNSFVEESTVVAKHKKTSVSLKQMKDVNVEEHTRIKTDIYEFDRVLGDGFVKGSTVLLSGEPGIGKSTLLLQAASSLCEQNKKILYISAEESSTQIKLRAERLEKKIDEAYIHCSGNFSSILSVINECRPEFIIIDSIQTIYTDTISSAPGSVSQVRETVSSIIIESRAKDITVILVGHVTKDGMIAGPKVIEHLVDVVLYFEGERDHIHRILRAKKNRFGSIDEIGIFNMNSKGLEQVSNPSSMFLYTTKQVPGTVKVPALQGNRPIIVEIQALVTSAGYQNCRRIVTGVDINRVHILLAILEKIAGLHVQSCDVFINVPGGLKLTETAVDAAIICAVVSSFKNISLSPHLAVFGEVGLSGEMRPVLHTDKRMLELKKMGMKNCILPNIKVSLPKNSLKYYCVDSIVEMIEELVH